MRCPGRPASSLLLLLACACGDDSPAAIRNTSDIRNARPRDRIDACSIVTGEDVAAVLGLPDEPGKGLVMKLAYGTKGTCTYSVPIAGARFPATLNIQIDRPTSMSARALFDSIRRGASSGTDPATKGEDQSGLGDGALWCGTAKNMGLSVLKGEYVLYLSISFLEKDTLPLCRALAERALPRLP